MIDSNNLIYFFYKVIDNLYLIFGKLRLLVVSICKKSILILNKYFFIVKKYNNILERDILKIYIYNTEWKL